MNRLKNIGITTIKTIGYLSIIYSICLVWTFLFPSEQNIWMEALGKSILLLAAFKVDDFVENTYEKNEKI